MDREKYSTVTIKTRWKLQWGSNRFKLLGIIFGTDLNKINEINYKSKIEVLKSKLHNWQRRHLTPLGKITVIKSLLIPCLNHLFLALPNPSEKIMKEINDILFTFLWEGTARIKRSVICKDSGWRIKDDKYQGVYKCLKNNMD